MDVGSTGLSDLLSLPPEDIGSSGERRAILSSRLMALIVVVSVILCLTGELINGGVTKSIFISIIATSILLILLNRLSYPKLARVSGLAAFNFILFNVSSSEPYDCGSHLHLITAGFAALIIFGHEERILGLFFAFLSLGLYLISYQYPVSLLAERKFTHYQVTLFFLVNVVVFGIVNSYLVRILLSLNFKIESKLRRINDELVARNSELSKVNAELDRFVYSASHELRAPLTSILGLVNLQKLDRPSSDVYLDLICDRIHALDKLIHNIIDYSKNNRTQIVNEEIALAELIHEICDQMRFGNTETDATILLNVDKEHKLNSNTYRLRVVLNNLVSNAIKYSDPNKPDPFVRISSYVREDRYLIEVADNGIGIPEEHQQRVFDMFYRATNKMQGSGLGLYIVKEAVQLLKGEISLESKHGEGTVFRVWLPIVALQP